MIWVICLIPAYIAIGIGVIYILSNEFETLSEEPGFIGAAILMWPLALPFFSDYLEGKEHRRKMHLENVAK